MNTDVYVNMALSVLLELLKTTIPKNLTSKKKWKKALLKVFQKIAEAYKDDEEFKSAV
jgi:hypothetical protein